MLLFGALLKLGVVVSIGQSLRQTLMLHHGTLGSSAEIVVWRLSWILVVSWDIQT